MRASRRACPGHLPPPSKPRWPGLPPGHDDREQTSLRLRIPPQPLYLPLNRKGDMPMTEELLYDIRDGIGHVTFNRPQARNALTFPMYERLAEIAASPGEARALVLTGAGDKAFAAGTDINQFRTFSNGDDALAY